MSGVRSAGLIKNSRPQRCRLISRCVFVLLFGIVDNQVRYDPNSQFNEHGHPDGEEILVLEGAWQGEISVVGL